jgi:hypothetical protein
MKDFELHNGLSLLADEAEPAAIDVFDVIGQAKTRTRNRRATMATALATVTVAGAMIATIGLSDSSSGTNHAGSRTSPATKTSTSPAPEMIPDQKSRNLTQQLAEIWSTIVPAGVTVEASPEARDLAALEFGGLRIDANQSWYKAHAKLSDAQGTTLFDIEVWPAGITNFVPCAGDPDCTYHQLGDDYQANLRSETARALVTATATTEADIMRPDGTRIHVREENAYQVPGHERLTRPTTFFTAEGMTAFRFLTY